jgi:transposase
LTAEERDILTGILNKDKQGVRKRKRAQALLLAGDQLTDEAIAEQVGMHRRGVENLRRRFAEDGCEVTLEGKPHGRRPRSIQGEDEARLIALIRSPGPGGRRRWALRALKAAWMSLEGTHTKTVSHETIRQTLKKLAIDPGADEESGSRRQETAGLQPVNR